MEINNKQNSNNSDNNNDNKLQFKTKDFLEMNPTRYFAVVEDRNLVKKVSYYHAVLKGFNTKDLKTVEVPAELVNSLNEFFEALYNAL